MTRSTIEWTDEVWNFVTGCTKVSPGCDNCYAERFAERWRGVKGHAFEQGFDLKLRPERLEDPYRWKKPRRVFVNSMSDVFHRDVPDEFIDQAWSVMAINNRHTFQVLTKRPERMRRWAKREDPLQIINDNATDNWMAAVPPDVVYPLPNVWLGVSVESPAYRWRMDMLKDTPAAVRFVSVEPLVERFVPTDWRGIDWVILGGESGPKARPCEPYWMCEIVEDIRRTSPDTKIFVKQMGERWARTAGLKSRKGGEIEEIPEDLRIREYPG